MNANAFRHFYDYHLTVNRWIGDSYITGISYEQFTRDMGYSRGSVRNQVIHLFDVDETWFNELRGAEEPGPFPAAVSDDRESIRAYWDGVEQMMRAYLAQLRDDMLFERPIKEPEEYRDLMVWQVLLHVVNHGTDHRAQLLRFLHDLGVNTESQDYVFYAYRVPFQE